MRHRRKAKHFGRKAIALKALWRGLIINMVEHGRIKTTQDKAKELRGHVERAITLGKKNDLATRRLLLSRVPHEQTVEKILSDLSPRFKDRNGGYTRIIKIGRRPGDTAEMAFIEFVDYDYTAVKPTATEGKASKGKKSAKAADGDVVAKKKTAAKKETKKAKASAEA